jgi:ribosomal-protein-alanine N-acetyltransferase
MRLLDSARRSFAAFGPEDLPQLLAHGDCLVAGGRDKLWAFIAVSVNPSGWAYLRGVAITDGWRSDDGLNTVLDPLIGHLQQRAISHLAAYGTALWLVPALGRSGFQRREWIVTLERHARPVLDGTPEQFSARPVNAGDLAAITELDNAAFDPPFQLAGGELIQLMVTSGHFVVLETEGGDRSSLLAYVCADVLGDAGQVSRLAVHPAAQRQGIGYALLNQALAYCQANGASRVVVNTQDSNTSSLSLYGRLGFRRVGRRIPLMVREL